VVAVDTNLLVRIFTKDDAVLYTKAARILAEAQADSLLLDRITLAELGYVLRARYPYNKANVAEIYKSLLRDGRFRIVDRELVEMTVGLFDSEHPLSFEDCWLLALKRAGKVKSIATFDTNLSKRL
jgi:predicted nucleic acid-binding protein